ncbi:MAG: phosphopyruvate hydratase [Candidatus Micrarchaeota archaeon]
MAKIKKIQARQVLDSRGDPTIAVEINGCTGIAPSGASTCANEALELRDGGKKYGGKGVTKAVSIANNVIARKVKGKNFKSIREFDDLLIELDATKNKSKLGGNTTTACSIAFAKALAADNEIEPFELLRSEFKARKRGMPMPCANMINGGKHASNDLPIQEHMLMPKTSSFAEAARCCSEVFHELKKGLVAAYGKTAANIGDEGGFTPPLTDSRVALELIQKSAVESGWGKKTRLGIDAAATSFYNEKTRAYAINNRAVTAQSLASYYLQLAAGLPLIYLEDPFFESDSKNFSLLTSRFGGFVIADDLTVTNPALVSKAVNEKAANGLIVKINQVGTVSEAADAALIARKAGWVLVASHRSGETEDPFLADFAVGLGCEYLKLGAPNRSERLIKYNRVLEIEGLK